MEVGPLGFGIFAGGLRQGRVRRNRLYSLIEAVVPRDTAEVPLYDLRDGVAVFAIERVQPVDGYVHQVTVDGCLMWGWRTLRSS